jgi:hypothetical protein
LDRKNKNVLSPVTKKTPVLFGKISQESAKNTILSEKKEAECLPPDPNDEQQLSFCLHIKTTFQLCFPLQPDQISFLNKQTNNENPYQNPPKYGNIQTDKLSDRCWFCNLQSATQKMKIAQKTPKRETHTQSSTTSN